MRSRLEILPRHLAHWFSATESDLDYLVFRVDPGHVLPAGYVHPLLQSSLVWPERANTPYRPAMRHEDHGGLRLLDEPPAFLWRFRCCRMRALNH